MCFCLSPVNVHRLSFEIRETIRPVHYCKIIDKPKKVREGNLTCPDNDFTIEAILICFTGILKGMCTRPLFSSQFATLIIIITGSPGNKSLHQLRYHIATTVEHRRARETPQSLMHTSSLHHWGTMGTCVFYFLFWMLKSQSLHMSSLNEN